MTSTAELFAFLTFTALTMVYHCRAGDSDNVLAARLRPPTGLSYRWVDAFTVDVSWQEPIDLPEGDIWYKYRLEDPESPVKCVKPRNFTKSLFTAETGSGNWTYRVWTVRGPNEMPDDSIPVFKTIETPKPRADVKDIKCLVDSTNEEINCSWDTGSHPINLTYRICGHSHEHIMGLSACVRPYGDAMRQGCFLKADNNDICMCFESEAGLSTFKLAPMIDPPEFSIREEGDYLNLTWTSSKILNDFSWIFTVCYKKCSLNEVCLDSTTKEQSMLIAYDNSCRYEFRSSVKTAHIHKKIFSIFGQVVSYGTNKPAGETLTVVAIVLPTILSVCILLSCYCFRRHSSIICPVIPDPSAIFKEMMMNGNKELKTTTGSLYTPVPEPIESCKVDPVTESIVIPLNS